MDRLRFIYYSVSFILFTTIAFIGLCLVWLVTVPFDRRRRVAVHRYSRFWSRSIYGLCPWWKVKVSGLENIKHGQPYIVVSNHQAMLDIPLLYNLPFNFKWVSKREVYKIPIFGWVLWMHGDVTIERGGSNTARLMMAHSKEYLDMGVSIIIFPEGTRTKTGEINSFKEGAMMLAMRSGVPILPVVIDGTYDAFTGDYRISSAHTFQVKVLPPISYDEISKSTLRELRDTLNTMMREEHKGIAPRHYNNFSD